MVPEPREGGQGPTGMEQAGVGQENHQIEMQARAGCCFCPGRPTTNWAS